METYLLIEPAIYNTSILIPDEVVVIVVLLLCRSCYCVEVAIV
jgi:hypothetical protein